MQRVSREPESDSVISMPQLTSIFYPKYVTHGTVAPLKLQEFRSMKFVLKLVWLKLKKKKKKITNGHDLMSLFFLHRCGTGAAHQHEQRY